jgi:predicted nucleic acid-binding protein
MDLNLSSRIPDGATVLVDSCPIIYVLEGSALAAPFDAVFADIDAGRIRGLVTPISLAEVVSGPISAGKDALAERYRQTLTASAGWGLREIDADVAMLAARLRLRHRLRLPDALQLAVAVHEGCHALLTHDRDFAGVTDILVLGAGTRGKRRRRPRPPG